MKNSREKYFLYVILGAIFVLTFFVFIPFLIPLILGIIFAILILPLHKFILSKTGNRKSLSAVITVIFFILIIGIPIVSIGILGFKESQNLFNNDINSISTQIDILIESTQAKLPSWIQIDLSNQIESAIQFVSNNTKNIFSATFSTILSFVLVILSLFFFLKDGSNWKKILFSVSPLSEKHNQYIFVELQKSIHGITKGYLLIALIQGFVMSIGLWIFGVPQVILLGITTGLAAMVPTVGTFIVSIPVAIYLFFTAGLWPTVGFLSWALLIVGTIDNILNPLIVGKQANIHPLLILLSILGGISFFGPAGILLGPVLVSLLIILIKIYRKDFE